MPLYTTDALILRTYQLGEVDRIVVFLTSDRGKKRGVANGARRLKSRFVGGLEPLTLARLAYDERERRDLVRLRYVDPVRSPLMARDGDVLGYVEYFAELIDECAPEADPNPTLYRLGAAVVDSLVDATPVERLARYVEYWVLRLQGVYPSLVACHRCGGDIAGGGRIDPAGAGFTCTACASGRGMVLSERRGAVPSGGGGNTSRGDEGRRAADTCGARIGAGPSTADQVASGEGTAVNEGAQGDGEDDVMRKEVTSGGCCLLTSQRVH